jgi:uncharacterized protein YutE (UPF0331/DUF86 family)
MARQPGPRLAAKVAQLRDYHRELNSWLSHPPAEPLTRVLERMVQLVVECAVDAGDLWLDERGRPLGQSAMNVFQGLHNAGVLDTDMLERFRVHVKVRNRIVHDYDVIRPEEVRASAEGLSQDIPELIRALLKP